MEFSKRQIEELDKPLNTEVVLQRKGPGGRNLSYLPSYHVINEANRIFGYDGWSYTLSELDTKIYQFEGKTHCRSRAVVKVRIHPAPEPVPAQPIESVVEGGVATKTLGFATLRATNNDDLVKEDVGHGSTDVNGNIPDIENAEKEAVSDAMKRALRPFGNQFGNCLYDKDFWKTADQETEPAQPQEERMASDKQIGFIQKLLKSSKKDLSQFTNKQFNEITSTEASKIIKEIQS